MVIHARGRHRRTGIWRLRSASMRICAFGDAVQDVRAVCCVPRLALSSAHTRAPLSSGAEAKETGPCTGLMTAPRHHPQRHTRAYGHATPPEHAAYLGINPYSPPASLSCKHLAGSLPFTRSPPAPVSVNTMVRAQVLRPWGRQRRTAASDAASAMPGAASCVRPHMRAAAGDGRSTPALPRSAVCAAAYVGEEGVRRGGVERATRRGGEHCRRGGGAGAASSQSLCVGR